MQKSDSFYKNYELIDFGQGRKLESFSGVILDRSAPQAMLKKTLPASVWNNSDASFVDGSWNIKRAELEEGWKSNIGKALIELKLATGGQLGVFPEQMQNWGWLHNVVFGTKKKLNIFNGFAYTGLSSIFASSSYSRVCHVDASKSAVSWAKKNAELSSVASNDIRWIVDDVMTFLNRERKRGIRYDGFILDPPAFGRSKDKKTWSFKRDITSLIELSVALLSTKPAFYLFTCHETDIDVKGLKVLLDPVNRAFKSSAEVFEMELRTSSGKALKAGLAGRLSLL